jgi:hypothetical protein
VQLEIVEVNIANVQWQSAWLHGRGVSASRQPAVYRLPIGARMK